MVNEFSDFARMPKPIFKNVDLNKIISRSINLHELSETDIKFNLSKKNKNLTICTYRGLKKLLENLDKDIKVISSEEVKENDYDFQLSLGDIPKLLEFKKFEEIPYYQLNIKDETTNHELNLSKKKLNIGFAWCGNPKFPNDKYRSIPLNKFNKIINFENFKFFKLQTLLKPDEVHEYKSYNNIEDLGKKNFYDLANIIIILRYGK